MTGRPRFSVDVQAVDAAEVERWASAAAHAAEVLGQPINLTDAVWLTRCAWLAAYVQTFDMAHAARVAGCTTAAVRLWYAHPVFAALLADAKVQVREHVAGELYRRAMNGTTRGVWHQGTLVGTEQIYSDRLLETLARRVDPAWSGQTETVGDDQQARLVAAVLADPQALAAAQSLADRLAELGRTPDAPALEQ